MMILQQWHRQLTLNSNSVLHGARGRLVIMREYWEVPRGSTQENIYHTTSPTFAVMEAVMRLEKLKADNSIQKDMYF